MSRDSDVTEIRNVLYEHMTSTSLPTELAERLADSDWGQRARAREAQIDELSRLLVKVMPEHAVCLVCGPLGLPE